MDNQTDVHSNHPDGLHNSLSPPSFLQVPQDSSRNVPCSFSDDINSSSALCKFEDTEDFPPDTFLVKNNYNPIGPLNSSKISDQFESDIQNKSLEFSVSKPNSGTDDHAKHGDHGIKESNESFIPCNMDSVHSSSDINDSDVSVATTIIQQSDDAVTEQTCMSNSIQSTNFLETKRTATEEKEEKVGYDSECNYQDTGNEVSDERIRNVGNGHYSDVQSGSRTKSGSNGAKKRKSGDDELSNVRGANSAKRRQPAVTYLSQISPDQNGIKLKIKKSPGTSVRKYVKCRERARNQKGRKNEEEENNDLCDKSTKEQSKWGSHLPVPVLIKIFSFVTQEEGCLPFLVRMSSVCRLWREAAVAPSLWNVIDLSGPWVRNKFKSEAQLVWLCENRLSLVEDLNVGGWKVPGKWRVFQTMVEQCKRIHGITLTGWTGLNGEHLKYLVDNCHLLSRIDLSSVFPIGGPCRSNPVSMVVIRNLCETLGARLTHLILADNKVAGINQIVSVLTASCPNIEVFDISNLWSTTFLQLNIERLQAGCQKLRVFRASNCNFSLVQTPLKQQVESPGFPCLEELSVATDGLSLIQPIVDDESLERILKTSNKLRLLDVRGCQRITESSLVRVPAWDLEHLFLSGCYVTKTSGSGLELVVRKWSHSLKELDIGWCSSLDNALEALTEKGEELPLRILDLCGTSVSLDSVKTLLMRCPCLQSLNLASCRALPRGIKRLYEGIQLAELKSSLLEKPEAPATSEDASAASFENPTNEMTVESHLLQDQQEAAMAAGSGT